MENTYEYRVVVCGKVVATRDNVWDAIDFAKQYSKGIHQDFYVQVYSPYSYICSYTNGKAY